MDKPLQNCSLCGVRLPLNPNSEHWAWCPHSSYYEFTDLTYLEDINDLVECGKTLNYYEDPRLRPLSKENFIFYNAARRRILEITQKYKILGYNYTRLKQRVEKLESSTSR